MGCAIFEVSNHHTAVSGTSQANMVTTTPAAAPKGSAVRGETADPVLQSSSFVWSYTQSVHGDWPVSRAVEHALMKVAELLPPGTLPEATRHCSKGRVFIYFIFLVFFLPFFLVLLHNNHVQYHPQLCSLPTSTNLSFYPPSSVCLYFPCLLLHCTSQKRALSAPGSAEKDKKIAKSVVG